MPLDLACPDWLEKLEAGRTPIPDLDYDRARADQAVAVYDNLHLPDVEGQPRLGDVGGEWFRDCIRAAFGLWDEETGARLIRELFILVPKKNSKTTNSAALALTFMLLNRRPYANMAVLGPTQAVADTCFEAAAGMIEADPESWLKKRFHVQEHRKTIQCRVTKATLKILTFDVKVAVGKKFVLVIIDELHEIAKNAKAAKVLGQLRGGMQPFPEALLVIITTQSDEPPVGVFRTELDFARGVRDGRIEGSSRLPVLYEFPEDVQTGEDAPWADAERWHLVHPNLGRSVHLDRLIEEFAEAGEKGIDELRRWSSQHLNIEIGLALHSQRWKGADHFPAAAVEGLTLDDLLDRSEVVTAGIDGGGLDDLAGFYVLGRERETENWLGWGRAWAHPEVFERRKVIVPQLADLQKAGDLVFCERPGQDIDEIVALCAALHASGKLPEEAGIGYDAAGLAVLLEALGRAGIGEPLMKPVSQGFRLMGAINACERRLKAKSLRPADQKLMRWCIGNAKPEQRGSALMITKAAAGRAKIDPLIAMFVAADLMARGPMASAGASPWDDENFRLSA